MKVSIKSFEEFTVPELYSVLQLRAAVFVVEQDCVYQDIDGKDHKATHIMGYKDDVLVAYTRVFAPGDYFENASIGRVVVNSKNRGEAYGQLIMKASLKFAVEKGWSTIKISAQCYLDKFYTDLGFVATGETYLEDGIPHQAMIARF